MNELIATPALLASDVSAVRFTGNRSDFRRLVTRGALLELLTLGFYRFWLATDIRRHLWSHTEIGGDTPEYTGTAKELLIGFLFALAILVPIYLAYFFITIEAEQWRRFASTPLFLFFYLFTQFAIYRARRYRLSRTVWRGVRFWMTGSGWAYAARAFGWSLLIGLTLGLALPWQRASLERYKMRHTFYGDLQGGFTATGGELFKRGWWLWLLLLIPVLLTLALPVVYLMGGFVRYGRGAAGGWVWLLILAPIFLTISVPFIYAIYKAIEWRWWISGLRLGDIKAKSGMMKGALIDLYWKVIGWGVLLAVILSGWLMIAYFLAMGLAGTHGATLRENQVAVLQHPAYLTAFAVGYIVMMLAFGAVMRLYLARDMWRRVVTTTIVHNLASADNVVGRGDAASALGEGFADSLDVAGF